MKASVILAILLVVVAALIVASPTERPGSDTAHAGSSLPGDANCDGIVNAIDAALVLQFSAGLLLGLPCPGNADANGDGIVNALDAALILQFAAGLIGEIGPSATDTPPAASVTPVPTNTATREPTATSTPANTPTQTPTNTPTVAGPLPPLIPGPIFPGPGPEY